MRPVNIIELLPTQYKRVSDTNPLLVGHNIPLLGTWSESTGYVKKTSLEYEGETLACPVIATVEEKFGGDSNVSLEIIAKTSKYKETVETKKGDHTIERKVYEDSGETIKTTLVIPRFVRPWATWVITGLGKNVFEISNITTKTKNSVGKINFYALASAGSKIVYWFGIHKLAEELRTILRPWVAPPKCPRCKGTGIEPDTDDGVCEQCEGYKYDGYSSTGYVQRMLGFDIGLSRELLDWDNMTTADHTLVRKFINKCWTQKWWVTPTVKQIKKFFAHFYMIEEDEVLITERFNLQEPVWHLELPGQAQVESPFGRTTEADRELMEYIAESITPAGVSVFVGFYQRVPFGEMEFDDVIILPINHLESGIEHVYEEWGQPRWDFWNGWTEATRVFEVGIGMDISGDVDIFNANDQNRHVCRLKDNAYVETGMMEDSGYFDLWIHPEDTTIRCGIIDLSGDWKLYVEYNSSGFFDHFGDLLTLATPDSDYHISCEFGASGGSGCFDVSIQREFFAEDILCLTDLSGDKFRVENIGVGYGFVDAIGLSTDPDYDHLDNWQRIYPWGWGLEHLNDISGETDLYNDYFIKDRFFVI